MKATMSRTDSPLLHLHPNDNVLVAKTALALGQEISELGVRTRAQVPAGHKIAARRIAAGEQVKKYDTVIGVATRDLEPGDYVHSHNLQLVDYYRDPAFGADVQPVDYVPEAERATFQGFVRPGGGVGTRNFIGILSSVNCSATVIKRIAAHFTPERLAAYPHVDGVAAFAQTSGCGMSSPSEHFDVLRRTLAGYARHPNLAGVLIVGLGCERNQVDSLVDSQGLREGKLLRTMVMQDVGGTRATIEAGIRAIEEMLPIANEARRTTVSASHLKIGLECGGSDGFSGITANPGLGAAMDILVRHGGTAILSETPEVYGAEHLLTRRAVRPEVGQKLVDRIKWWEHYTEINEGEMNNNPSPGNKAGGLTTVLEKSLGGIAKAGSTNLMDVYEYAQPVRSKGLVFMDTPGYDPISATGQVAGGANLICFTTGRGSAYGCAPTPSLKLATNSALWQRQEEDMDINCGEIVDGTASIQEMGQRIFDLVLATASGEPSKSEKHGYGQNEFVPWQIGAVM